MSQPPENHLILMLKTPKMGTVKTRLAKDCGWITATRFYRETANRLITQLGNAPRWQGFLAITPDAGLHKWPWPARGQSRLKQQPQGKGNLGARMQNVFKNHAPHPALIIGTDIPGITPAHINQAFRAIHENGFVIAPSGDGGYWCVGQKNCPRTINAFENVRWSTEMSLSDTLSNLKNPRQSTLETQLEDIDTGVEYKTRHHAKAGRWFYRQS